MNDRGPEKKRLNKQDIILGVFRNQGVASCMSPGSAVVTILSRSVLSMPERTQAASFLKIPNRMESCSVGTWSDDICGGNFNRVYPRVMQKNVFVRLPYSPFFVSQWEQLRGNGRAM